MHKETYEAFIEAGVDKTKSINASMAIAGEHSGILERLDKLGLEMHKGFSDVNQSMIEVETGLEKKMVILTTIITTSLPIFGLLIAFLLRNG